MVSFFARVFGTQAKRLPPPPPATELTVFGEGEHAVARASEREGSNPGSRRASLSESAPLIPPAPPGASQTKMSQIKTRLERIASFFEKNPTGKVILFSTMAIGAGLFLAAIMMSSGGVLPLLTVGIFAAVGLALLLPKAILFIYEGAKKDKMTFARNIGLAVGGGLMLSGFIFAFPLMMLGSFILTMSFAAHFGYNKFFKAQPPEA